MYFKTKSADLVREVWKAVISPEWAHTIYLWSLSNKGNGLDWNELLLLFNIGMNRIEC